MPDDVRPFPSWPVRLRPVLFHVGGPMPAAVPPAHRRQRAPSRPSTASHRRQPSLLLRLGVALALAVGRPLRFESAKPSTSTAGRAAAIPSARDDRRRPRQSPASLRGAGSRPQVLEADKLFAVYPGGTRSQDGVLHDGHNGVGHLSMTTGASVIPAGIVGADQIRHVAPACPTVPARRWSAAVRPSTRRATTAASVNGGSIIARDVMAAIRPLSAQTLPGRLRRIAGHGSIKRRVEQAVGINGTLAHAARRRTVGRCRWLLGTVHATDGVE